MKVRAATVRSFLAALVVGAVVAYLLCGLVVSWRFATEFWFVFVLGSAAASLTQLLLNRRRRSVTDE